MAILLGWQFTLATFAGAPVMVTILVFLFRRFLKPALLDEAKRQADRGLQGKMEGHAEMDMSVTEGPLVQRMLSSKGRTAISHYFVMDWVAVWKDIAGGLLIAGALGAWVPATWWNRFFLTNHPQLAQWWGPVAGPIVAIQEMQGKPTAWPRHRDQLTRGRQCDVGRTQRRPSEANIGDEGIRHGMLLDDFAVG